MSTPGKKIVYKMQWFDLCKNGKLRKESHTDMYFEKAEHTYWGFKDNTCKIEMILVDENSAEYESAVQNSSHHINAPLHKN